MQQRRDGGVFVAAVLQHHGGDRSRCAIVRHLRRLARLKAMQIVSQLKRPVELRRSDFFQLLLATFSRHPNHPANAVFPAGPRPRRALFTPSARRAFMSR